MDREAETGEAVSCAVSLDGVPLGPDGDGEAHWASSGTISGADGTRLKTLSLGRKPERQRHCSPPRSPMSGKCGPTLVADAAPDNWTFLEKLRPDERAADFFLHSEVSDRREQLEVPRRPARRRRRQGRRFAISATRRRQNRRFSGANSGFSASTGTACASLKANGCTLRRRGSRQQGSGQPAHETGALEHEVKMSSSSLVGPF